VVGLVLNSGRLLSFFFRCFRFRVMFHGFGKQVFSARLFIDVAEVIRVHAMPM